MTALLLHFTRLPATVQARFLECLNHYLFASPGRRSQLRRQWERQAPADRDIGGA
ncbi:hypothetical protein [Stenotrophomonas sp.]|uniref:hypothetical protein n=1 Tax=Stenotrophomonas sp. TaxID=69392 RepID=UPI002FC912D7